MPADSTHATPDPGAAPHAVERADLLDALTLHRRFLCFTVRGLSDEAARSRPTASELTLGGLVKHASANERHWIDFVVGGPDALPGGQFHADGEFTLLPQETLADVLAEYEDVARRTDALLAGPLDLDASQELPPAPWWPRGLRWTARRAVVHVIAETCHHAGHADILRESIDGQKTMG